MEGRNGAKIAYLAIILVIPTGAIKVINLLFSVVDIWAIIDFGTQIVLGMIFLFGLLFIGMLTYYTIQALRKPEIIEEQYKYPGWGVVVGLSLCIPIALGFVFQEQYAAGDFFTTSMFFIIGFLFIIAGIIMLQEAKSGTGQILTE